MKTFLLRTVISLSIVSGLLAWRLAPLPDRSDHGGLIRGQQTAMGTVWNIEVVDRGRPDKARRAISAAYSELACIEALMSEWRAESPILRRLREVTRVCFPDSTQASL
jgi:hypothetical protein